MSSGQKQPKSLKYSDAGVDIDEGDALIGDIAPHAKRQNALVPAPTLAGLAVCLIPRQPVSMTPFWLQPPMGLAPNWSLPKPPDYIAALALILLPCVQMIFWLKVQCRCFSLIILPRENWNAIWLLKSLLALPMVVLRPIVP